jgi:hypothetical protein
MKIYRSDFSMARRIKIFRSAQQILETYRKIFKLLHRDEGGGGGYVGVVGAVGTVGVVGGLGGGAGAGTETPSESFTQKKKNTKNAKTFYYM